MNTNFETDVALVYKTCTKVLLDSQIDRGGKVDTYKLVCELTHNELTDITVPGITPFVNIEGRLVVWGVFSFEREFSIPDPDCWRRTMITVKRRVREFAIAGSLPDLMRLVAEYCLTEPERSIYKHTETL